MVHRYATLDQLERETGRIDIERFGDRRWPRCRKKLRRPHSEVRTQPIVWVYAHVSSIGPAEKIIIQPGRSGCIVTSGRYNQV